MSKAEKFIQENTKNCSNLLYRDYVGGFDRNAYQPWLTPDQARKAVEIAREEIYEWLRVNLCNYFDSPRRFEMYLYNLKQAMKDDIRK